MRSLYAAPLVACALLCLDAQAADLLQIYRDAQTNDPVIASARASLQAGQERSVQSRAGLLPTVAASGSSTKVTTNSDSGTADYRLNTYSIALTQPLLRSTNWETYQQGKLTMAANQAQYAQAQQDLITRVAQAYFDVLAAQDVLAFVGAQHSAISEQLTAAKRTFEVGTSAITDTHEAQARFDLAGAQQIAAQNDLDVKTAALEQIIGKPPGILATVRSGLKLTAPSPAAIELWITSAEKANFTVISQQIALDIAQHELTRNRAGYFPTLDLVASHTRTNQNGGTIALPGGTSTSNAIGVQWQIPLFSGFAVTSKVREAIALEDKARSELDNARRSAAQAVRQAFLGVNSGVAQVNAYEAAEVSSQSALESNLLSYKVGVRINIDVLNAQQQFYSTRQLLAKARYDTLMAGLRLKAAAGKLEEEDLASINRLLAH